MSTASNVLNIPGRSMDHRPAWLLMVAAAAGAAITLSVSALVGRAPAPAPAAVRAAAPANAAGSDGSSTISSLRPFSDSFQVSVESGVPAIDQAGVVLNYPGGTVQVSAGEAASAGEAVQAPYAPGTIYAYPGGTVQVGMIGAGGSNENAPAVSNCHQCR